jgi:hypothetical protein
MVLLSEILKLGKKFKGESPLFLFGAPLAIAPARSSIISHGPPFVNRKNVQSFK